MSRSARAKPSGATRPTVVVVGRHEDLIYNAMIALGLAGHPVHVVSHAANARLASSRWCTQFSELDRQLIFDQDEHFTEWMIAYVERHAIDLVLAADYDLTVWLASNGDALAPARSFPVPEAELIAECNNKWRLMQLCESIGVDVPRNALITELDDVAGLDIDGPVVVKPLAEGFSLGVYTLPSTAAIAEHLARDDRPGNELPQLVQEFVAGVDLDATILADHGEMIAGAVQCHEPRTSSIRYLDDPDTLALVARIAKETGFHGIMDVGLRRTVGGGRTVVIECNPRLPASTLKKAFAGVNLVAEGARLALGEPPAAPGPASGTVYPLRPASLVACPPWRWLSDDAAPTRRAWSTLLRDWRFSVARARTSVAARLPRSGPERTN